jgi:hypothetical protein
MSVGGANVGAFVSSKAMADEPQRAVVARRIGVVGTRRQALEGAGQR